MRQLEHFAPANKKTKVTFVEPALIYGNTKVFPRHPPQYAAYAAALLEQKGFYATIIDAFMDRLSENETIEKTVNSSPDVVLILPFDYTRETPVEISQNLASNLRSGIPGALIGMAGSMSEDFLKESILPASAFDFAIVGEYELPILDIAQALSKGQPIDSVFGMLFRKNGGTTFTGPAKMIEDLDDLPFPAWHLIDFQKYVFIPHRYRYSPFYPLLASRGCPFACRTCKEARLAKITHFRLRSVANVIEEIRFAKKVYGAKEIQFSDATFGLQREWVLKLCEAMVQENLNIPWSALCRVDTVDLQMLKAMAKAGCWNILYGIESGNRTTLELIKKGFSVEQAQRAVLATKQAGIETTGSFILGLPNEGRKEVMQTIRFAIELDLDYAQFFLLKEIGQSNDLSKWGRFTENWDFGAFDFRGPVFISDRLSGLKELKELQKLAYRKFYFRWRFVWRKAKEFLRPGQAKRIFSGALIALKAAFGQTGDSR